MNKNILVAGAVAFLISVFLPTFALAAPLTSPNYKLDPQGLNAVGGQGSSSNYRMVSSGGEAVVGNGSGGSYKLSSGYVGQLQQSIELNLTDSGLQAYYPLDTNTGIQAYDASANNNNGVLTNAPSWIPGKLGNALDFTASGSEYVTVPNNASLNPTTALTISAWVKPASTTGPATNYAIVSKENYGSKLGYYFYLGGYGQSNVFAFLVGDGTNQVFSVSNVQVTNTSQWYHLVGVFDGTRLKTYVDGVLKSDVASSVSSISNTSGPMTIGAESSPTQYMDGSIDEVKILNRALSAQEITKLYDANSAGIATSLTLPQVVPGIPQTASLDMTVLTDAGGYDAAISQNNNLTHSDASTTIPAMSTGSVATPALWDDGTTKGLGFTITGGVSVPAKWGTGPVNYKYAALPNSATTFFSRTGLSGGQKEVTNMQFKLDVPTNQKSGQYTNVATVTATLKP